MELKGIIFLLEGLNQTPERTSTRIISFAFLLFSMIMYNFYTSSVVGGLLSTRVKGPQNLSELAASPLILSFEDVGYNKIVFRVITLHCRCEIFLEIVLYFAGSKFVALEAHLSYESRAVSSA